MSNDSYLNDIIGWDIKNWSQCLNFWEKNIQDADRYENALELGAHHGGLSIWLAEKADHVVCSDIDAPSQSTYALHKKYDVNTQISYSNVDATAIPFRDEFDLVCFKSILGGIGRKNNIENQKKTINEIYKSLKSGGCLLFAENLKASPFHKLSRRLFVSWGSEWRYVKISEIKIFMSEFSDLKIKTVGFLGAFGRTESQRRILSVFDTFFFNFIIPKSWRYIIMGIAKK